MNVRIRSPSRVLAVTTRNQLRSIRFCLPMLRARRLIAEQLANQPGLLRYASGVSGPTEFFTLTVWNNRESMQRFMQTGAHEQHMWLFARWSASFWGMRWERTAFELETWSGLALARLDAERRPTSPLVATGLLPAHVPRAGPLGPRPESSAAEPRGSRIFALTARFEGAQSSLSAWRHGRVQRRSGDQSTVLRSGVGLDLPPQALRITLYRDEPGVRERALHGASAEGATWAMCWQPADYEIGHWDRLRLRQLARRQAHETIR